MKEEIRLRILPEHWVVAEGNHGFNNPEDGAVVAQQIFSQRDKFLTGSFHQEALNVFIEPRLVPPRHMIDLRLLRGILYVGEMTDHDDCLFFAEHGGFQKIGDLIQ